MLQKFNRCQVADVCDLQPDKFLLSITCVSVKLLIQRPLPVGSCLRQLR